jgi:hypothetical protein
MNEKTLSRRMQPIECMGEKSFADSFATLQMKEKTKFELKAT